MGRVVVLKIWKGDFDQGFDVLLQICRGNAFPSQEIPGRLPANTELKHLYTGWQVTFIRLTTQRETVSDWDIESRPTNYSTSEVDLRRSFVREIETSMRSWLQYSQDPGWQRIREKLVKELANKSDEIRVVITVIDSEIMKIMCKLPWHKWDLMESNSVEPVFSFPNNGEPELTQTNYNNQVRILAVFGDNNGIDTQPDQDAIRQLSGADPEFLSQPISRELIQNLRRPEGWDIFFFAGHSETNGAIGRIYINQSESLEISDFRNALREAVCHGLKLAIFNSCDGLGLARQLADLQLPVIIVMREPVPDEVAQSFLKQFLTEYAGGQPLCISVRRARESLEEFQNLPGATWLPMICLNPATVPPTWEDMCKSRNNSTRKGVLLPRVLLSVLLILLPFFLKRLPFHIATSLPSSSFQNSCKPISIAGSNISAKCGKKENRGNNLTTISVPGIRNNDGNLRFEGFSKPSNFQDPNECKSISIAGDEISGDCQGDDGSYNKTSIKVPGIHNHDGNLGINPEDKQKFPLCYTFKAAGFLFYLCR